MSLRYQLLLLALLTLFLPWAGCRYAREMETVLREGQEQALLASATTLANLLATRPQLLYPESSRPEPFDPDAGDVYAYRLRSEPLLDGYGDDWALPPDALTPLPAAGAALHVDYAAGFDDRNLYLLLVVADATPRLEQSSTERDPETRADHAWIAFLAPNGTNELYLFSTSAPGLLSARQPVVSTYGQRREVPEPRIQAYWQPEPHGYRLEIRVPASMVGSQLGFEIVDVADDEGPPIRIGTLDPATHAPRGRLLLPSARLASELDTLLPIATRAAVADINGWVLAEAGLLQPAAAVDYESVRPARWLESLYRRVLESGRESLPTRRMRAGRLIDPPADVAYAGANGSKWFRLADERRTLLAVSAPIKSAGEPLGVLVLEQANDRLLTLRDRALTRLLNITFIATAVAALALLAFATVISLRLARLKRAAETALTPDGRVNAVIPGTGARDELGDLSRSFAALLQRLNEYTDYLRTLAGKLSHELRTPLAIVRSSLDNLESERDASGVYVQRAREGTDRLQAILTAMGAATRTEEAIRHTQRVRFDLAELVGSMTRAYADTFRSHQFVARGADGECPLSGAPELIVQLLDKLVENAIDFSASGAAIELALEREGDSIALSVFNPGAPIPAEVRARLFDSLFQFRRDAIGKPHFGLGLHIVRLIAEFHGGRAFAENPPSGGVRVGARFPVPVPQSGPVQAPESSAGFTGQP
ncbi:MAG TPA: ATP-binding protein [Steroidobacteraceae bacterium]|nr:ATP-binding protein [Steroidobacteraceae bacterium]